MAVSQASPGPAAASLDVFTAELLRTKLLVARALRTAELAADARAIDRLVGVSGEASSRERALTALHMYGVLAAIEDIDDALAGVETGAFGTCSSCQEPIPFECLLTSPQARLCAACEPPLAGQHTGPRLGSARGGHTSETAPRPGVLATAVPTCGARDAEHPWPVHH